MIVRGAGGQPRHEVEFLGLFDREYVVIEREIGFHLLKRPIGLPCIIILA
jgi:hypothetical protein